MWMKLQQERQRTYNVTLRRVRATTLQLKSSKYYPFRQRVFAVLGIQNGMRMRHTVICNLSGSAIFFHITFKRQQFRKKKLRIQNVCFVYFTT